MLAGLSVDPRLGIDPTWFDAGEVRAQVVCGQRRRRPARGALRRRPEAGWAPSWRRCASPPTGRRCSSSTRPPRRAGADRGAVCRGRRLRAAGERVDERPRGRSGCSRAPALPHWPVGRAPAARAHGAARAPAARRLRPTAGRCATSSARSRPGHGVRRPGRRLRRDVRRGVARGCRPARAPSCTTCRDPRARQRPAGGALGRIAGQFAKPRSCAWSGTGGESLPVYRGDAVNGVAADRGRLAASRPAPTAHRVRQLGRGDPAAICAAGGGRWCGHSHEAMLCEYEEPLVRIDRASGRAVRVLRDTCCGWGSGRGHGRRSAGRAAGRASPTRSRSSSARRRPPPRSSSSSRRSTRDRQPGRLVLIARLGADRVSDRLPRARRGGARRPALSPVWLCDPMHGNTFKHRRRTQDPGDERRRAPRSAGSSRVRRRRGASGRAAPGGHPDDVTECVETRATALAPADLPRYGAAAIRGSTRSRPVRSLGAFAPAVRQWRRHDAVWRRTGASVVADLGDDTLTPPRWRRLARRPGSPRSRWSRGRRAG